MKTEVTMRRGVGQLKTDKERTVLVVNMHVRQKHKTGFFNLHDLEVLGNEYRKAKALPYVTAATYFKNQSSKEFIRELEAKYGVIQVGGNGRGNEKWVHPYLFMDIAMWYNPSLKVLVYTWMTDNLLSLRDTSGESFKGMVKAISLNLNLVSKLPRIMPDVCKKIQEAVGVSSTKGKWEDATKEQLALRDNIHTRIETLTYVLSDINSIVDMAIKSALNSYEVTKPHRRKIKKIAKDQALKN